MPAAAPPLISMRAAALAAPMPASVQWKPLGSASCVVTGAGVALRCGRYWPCVCSLIRLSAQGSICATVTGRFWPNECSPLSGAEDALLRITALYAHGSREPACAAGAAIAAAARTLPIHLRMRISASFVAFRFRNEPREALSRGHPLECRISRRAIPYFTPREAASFERCRRTPAEPLVDLFAEPGQCLDRLGGERAGAELPPNVVGVGEALDSRFPLSRGDQGGAGAELGLAEVERQLEVAEEL